MSRLAISETRQLSPRACACERSVHSVTDRRKREEGYLDVRLARVVERREDGAHHRSIKFHHLDLIGICLC